MLNAIIDFSIIIANLGGVLGLSGLLMLNLVFPTAVERCPAWAKPLFQIVGALGAIVVVGVLIQHADEIWRGPGALGASSLSLCKLLFGRKVLRLACGAWTYP